jgi:hypothetical protein
MGACRLHDLAVGAAERQHHRPQSTAQAVRVRRQQLLRRCPCVRTIGARLATASPPTAPQACAAQLHRTAAQLQPLARRLTVHAWSGGGERGSCKLWGGTTICLEASWPANTPARVCGRGRWRSCAPSCTSSRCAAHVIAKGGVQVKGWRVSAKCSARGSSTASATLPCG